MVGYTVRDSEGRIIGEVWGINGDVCWQLAQIANPGAAGLQPL